MVELKLLEEKDCDFIVDWNKGKDRNYMIQWAGDKVYQYPLNTEQISRRIGEDNIRIFKIIYNDAIVGSIELSNMDVCLGYGKISRFIISDEYSNKGIGQEALQQLIHNISSEFGINRFELGVFLFNKRAIGCYEKVGFTISKLNENQTDIKWNSYTMEYKL
jgi:RimJ/RimL family protein N-acetyltransferase